MKETTHKTFTLIELILVVAIVAILAGAMIPAITSARQKARVARSLQLVDTLRDACIMYHADTGEYAIEQNTTMPGVLWLSTNNGQSGWNGPYINESISGKDNPFGPIIAVHRRMSSGYDLDGNGTIDRALGSSGNQLVFWGVPETAAQIIDDHLDINIPGDWKVTGKVKYRALMTGIVQIYLLGGS